MIHKAFPTRWSLQKIIYTSLRVGSRESGTGGAVHGHAGTEVRCLALSDHCRLRGRRGTPAVPHAVISHVQSFARVQFCRSNSPRRLCERWRGHAATEKTLSRMISHLVQKYTNLWCDGNLTCVGFILCFACAQKSQKHFFALLHLCLRMNSSI